MAPRPHSEDPQIVFVCGFPRSGSTLFGDLLGSSSGVFHAGEIGRLKTRLGRNGRCSCGAALWDCSVWGPVLASIDPLGGHRREVSTEVRRSLWPVKRADRAQAQATLRRIYLELSKVTGCETIVDSSKVPSFGRLVLAATKGSAIVVHLVRDGRAAVNARLRKGRTRGLHRVVTIVAEAFKWLTMNMQAARLARRSSGSRVRYEDFVDDPTGRIQAVLEPIGHRIPKDWTTDGISISDRHVVWGNTKAAAGPVEIQPDLRWLREMPPVVFAVVSLMQSPLLLSYGYSLRSRSHLIGST